MIKFILKVMFFILGFLAGLLNSKNIFHFLLGVFTRNIVNVFRSMPEGRSQ